MRVEVELYRCPQCKQVFALVGINTLHCPKGCLIENGLLEELLPVLDSNGFFSGFEVDK